MASYVRIGALVYVGVDHAYATLTMHAHAAKQKKN